METPRPQALTTNKAVAMAVRDADVDVVAAYPITPQTTVVESIAEMIANGELDAEIIHVESEHSALSAVVGSSATGARVFTATSSQGLELMHEILHIASGLRLPIVMSVAMRALSAPISIWNDHSDVMNARDTGWIIFFVSSAQEAYDTVLQAYKIAEDPSVHLPVMVAYDGYLMSHTAEPVRIEGREKAQRFVPRRADRDVLNPDKPVTMGPIAYPEYYYEFKYQQVKAMENALKAAARVGKEFEEVYGRRYGLVETYLTSDAEIALLVTSSYWDNARLAAQIARREGIKAGVIRLRLYRPFPLEDLWREVKNLEVLGVIDRAISYGAHPSGPLAMEITAALHGRKAPVIQSIIAGIGQRVMLLEDYVRLYKLLDEIKRGVRRPDDTIFYGVRGVEI